MPERERESRGRQYVRMRTMCPQKVRVGEYTMTGTVSGEWFCDFGIFQRVDECVCVCVRE